LRRTPDARRALHSLSGAFALGALLASIAVVLGAILFLNPERILP